MEHLLFIDRRVEVMRSMSKQVSSFFCAFSMQYDIINDNEIAYLRNTRTLKWYWHKFAICCCHCWYLSSIETDDLPTLPSELRKVPKSLEEILRITKFTKSEIRLLYKGFKQVWKNFLWFLFIYFCINRNVQRVQLPNQNFKQFIHIFFLMEIVKVIQVFYFVCWIDGNGCILHLK